MTQELLLLQNGDSFVLCKSWDNIDCKTKIQLNFKVGELPTY